MNDDMSALQSAYNGSLDAIEEAVEPRSYQMTNSAKVDDITSQLATDLPDLTISNTAQSLPQAIVNQPASTYDDSNDMQNFFQKFAPPARQQQMRQPHPQARQQTQRLSARPPMKSVRNKIPQMVEEQFDVSSLSTDSIIDVIDYILEDKSIKMYIKTAISDVVEDILRDKIEEVVDACIAEITA